MPDRDETETVVRLADGTILREMQDGSFRRVAGRSDWPRVDAASDADIEAMLRDDPDAAPVLDDAFWEGAMPAESEKAGVFMRLDRDVLDWFRAGGRGYQTRINAVLRHYVDSRRRTG